MRPPKNQLNQPEIYSLTKALAFDLLKFIILFIVFFNITLHLIMYSFGFAKPLKTMFGNLLQNHEIALEYGALNRTGLASFQFERVQIDLIDSREGIQTPTAKFSRIDVSFQAKSFFNIAISWDIKMGNEAGIRIVLKTTWPNLILDHLFMPIYDRYSGTYQVYLTKVPLKTFFDIYFARIYRNNNFVKISGGLCSGRVQFSSKPAYDDASFSGKIKLDFEEVTLAVQQTNDADAKFYKIEFEPFRLLGRMANSEAKITKNIEFIADPAKNEIHGSLQIFGLLSFKADSVSLRSTALKAVDIKPSHRFSYPWFYLNATTDSQKDPLFFLVSKFLHCRGSGSKLEIRGISKQLRCQKSGEP